MFTQEALEWPQVRIATGDLVAKSLNDLKLLSHLMACEEKKDKSENGLGKIKIIN